MACSPAHRRNMPIILSHRGNLVGPCPSAENRLATVRAALDCGWGVETDIRCAADGRFYISHDARPSAHETPAEDFFALFRAYPDATVALNIKELGSEEALIEAARPRRRRRPDLSVRHGTARATGRRHRAHASGSSTRRFGSRLASAIAANQSNRRSASRWPR